MRMIFVIKTGLFIIEATAGIRELDFLVSLHSIILNKPDKKLLISKQSELCLDLIDQIIKVFFGSLMITFTMQAHIYKPMTLLP